MNFHQKYVQQSAFDRAMGMSSRFDRPNSVDNWRHTRMLDMAKPVYRSFPRSRWLTVGDGRYGSDAAYLLQQGLAVIASSLTSDQLKQAHDRGLISEYQAENAEKLSLPDDSVDFVLCKESYHHFPRPPLALYEMLRVARSGVVLIEPVDNPRLLNWLRTLVKNVVRGSTQHEFEPSGNYLYRTSVCELRKLTLAMGGEVLAFKGFNDFFVARLSNCRSDTLNNGSLITRLGVFVQDALAKMQLMGYGLACITVFSAPPPDHLLTALKKNGFKVERLPKNPYT